MRPSPLAPSPACWERRLHSSCEIRRRGRSRPTSDCSRPWRTPASLTDGGGRREGLTPLLPPVAFAVFAVFAAFHNAGGLPASCHRRHLRHLRHLQPLLPCRLAVLLTTHDSRLTTDS